MVCIALLLTILLATSETRKWVVAHSTASGQANYWKLASVPNLIPILESLHHDPRTLITAADLTDPDGSVFFSGVGKSLFARPSGMDLFDETTEQLTFSSNPHVTAQNLLAVLSSDVGHLESITGSRCVRPTSIDTVVVILYGDAVPGGYLSGTNMITSHELVGALNALADKVDSVFFIIDTPFAATLVENIHHPLRSNVFGIISTGATEVSYPCYGIYHGDWKTHLNSEFSASFLETLARSNPTLETIGDLLNILKAETVHAFPLFVGDAHYQRPLLSQYFGNVQPARSPPVNTNTPPTTGPISGGPDSCIGDTCPARRPVEVSDEVNRVNDVVAQTFTGKESCSFSELESLGEKKAAFTCYKTLVTKITNGCKITMVESLFDSLQTGLGYCLCAENRDAVESTLDTTITAKCPISDDSDNAHD